MESIIEIIKIAWQWIRENHIDIVGIIMATIFAFGLFPPIFKQKKKPKDIKRPPKATLPEMYAKIYKPGESHVITTATDNFEKDEMTLMVGPNGIIEYNPPNEKSKFETLFEPWPEDKKKKPKRKLDL